jgi:hypothetical protein
VMALCPAGRRSCDEACSSSRDVPAMTCTCT